MYVCVNAWVYIYIYIYIYYFMSNTFQGHQTIPLQRDEQTE